LPEEDPRLDTRRATFPSWSRTAHGRGSHGYSTGNDKHYARCDVVRINAPRGIGFLLKLIAACEKSLVRDKEQTERASGEMMEERCRLKEEEEEEI